ncbi:dTDP-4-amino-4,6-dideoxygalactose transaminase [hydrothermal vent metagenome]|uniref:dTDP-4-amino-4,6-dideoxygalactose transaminase n=1 Tax=hydrothermal vent metagenome TaxID=652676 RepID=A0A3B1BK46_9ZZZZ
MTGNEIHYITQAHKRGMLAGDGAFTKQCHVWLEKQTGCSKALLTHSCTSALEMAALLLDIKPGDEIIMPSFTFVSTANAFVLRGGIPVFIDIHHDTLNMDEQLIEAAITSHTKAIVPVHYAGVACDMNAIIAIAKHHDLKVVEDAAQGIMSSYNGHALGSIGDLGTYSFHETKNVISGEGGALLVNDPELASRAEIIRDKGTDRGRFVKGQIDKYTWQEMGSSFLPGELIAAFLWAQLEEAKSITKKRLQSWHNYHALLEPLESDGYLCRPDIPDQCQHNAHMYYIRLHPKISRNNILAEFKHHNISAIFHYVPLHLSKAGKRFGRVSGSLNITEQQSKCLIRLPMWVGLTEQQQHRIVQILGTSITASEIE